MWNSKIISQMENLFYNSSSKHLRILYFDVCGYCGSPYGGTNRGHRGSGTHHEGVHVEGVNNTQCGWLG